MKKFTFITAIVLTANLLFAQIIHRQDNFPFNQQGINTKNSGQLTEQTKQVSSSPYLDSIIQAKMEIGHVPGLSACIIKNGQVRWEGVYGNANIGLNIPVDTSTLFMLASVSKTITVTALMQLWEYGLFELEDDINDYSPFEIRNPNHPDDPITFKMLCTHTSSIKDNWSLCLISGMVAVIQLTGNMDIANIHVASSGPALSNLPTFYCVIIMGEHISDNRYCKIQ